jgi:4-hydroxy-3-methylbut-2-enyl diphosphate reductase
MKFTAAVVLAVAAASSTVSAFAPASTRAFAPRTATTASTQIFQSTEAAASETEEIKKLTKKEERLRMINDDRFYRRGFKEVREESLQTMNEQFESDIVKDLKTNNYVMERDGVKVYLAKVCNLPN